MRQIGRRNFLRGGIAALVLAFTAHAAESQGVLSFDELHRAKANPEILLDNQAYVQKFLVPALGPKGEATAGFYALFDTSHGVPLGAGWRATYRFLNKGNFRSTAPELVNHVINHMSVHHGNFKTLAPVLHQHIFSVWKNNPELRLDRK